MKPRASAKVTNIFKLSKSTRNHYSENKYTMVKSMKKLGKLRKLTEKLVTVRKLVTNIPAGLATPGPPLGPQLGQVSKRTVQTTLFLKLNSTYRVFLFAHS